MTSKQAEDKKKEGYPWTPRQKRRAEGSRKTRKQSDGVMVRMKRKEAIKQAAKDRAK